MRRKMRRGSQPSCGAIAAPSRLITVGVLFALNISRLTASTRPGRCSYCVRSVESAERGMEPVAPGSAGAAVIRRRYMRIRRGWRRRVATHRARIATAARKGGSRQRAARAAAGQTPPPPPGTPYETFISGHCCCLPSAHSSCAEPPPELRCSTCCAYWPFLLIAWGLLRLVEGSSGIAKRAPVASRAARSRW